MIFRIGIVNLVFLISLVLCGSESSIFESNFEEQFEKLQGQNAKTWIFETPEKNYEKVLQIVHDHHFHIIDKIDLNKEGLLNYYVLEVDHSRLKRSLNGETSDHILENTKKLQNIPGIFLNQEKVLKRTKRDFRPNNEFMMQRRGGYNLYKSGQVSKTPVGFFGQNPSEDPEWGNMWYLNRNLYNKNLPDMNVTGAWALGASGKGVSVTFLDDGLEYTHPDIKENYDPMASYDINSNDNDPIPRYEITNENKHGTRCAGEVAASANNSICSVGVAYHAGIGGIRMLDGDVTDSVEARSLIFNRDHISIYSASWGPDDNGQVVDGPGRLAKQAFSEGAKLGRGGLGSVFVWASGNGGSYNDSCACDGYANSIYTLSISSTSESSDKPWFLEECTSTLATTYSSGNKMKGEREIVTTDLNHKCTNRHTGTSAAAPLAAGIIALCLEVNPKLTWRDLMYLTVFSSRPHAIRTNNYIENKRGFLVSSRYGFGLMDAGRMVELAKNWLNVPEMNTCTTSGFNIDNLNPGKFIIDTSVTTNACFGLENEVNYIEQVEIQVTIEADIRGSVELVLGSPMGTSSLILSRRKRDKSRSGFKNWSFMTVQLWGESPRGVWKLHVSTIDGSHVEVKDIQFKIHGTKEKPAEYDKQIPAMRQVTVKYMKKIFYDRVRSDDVMRRLAHAYMNKIHEERKKNQLRKQIKLLNTNPKPNPFSFMMNKH